MTAATINGVQYHYIDAGEGQPLLFVHGFPLSSAAWKKQIKPFQSSYRVIAPDLRGFGDSEASSGAVPMTQYAEDLYVLLNELNAGPTVVVAHSMGGYVALAFARKFPEMVRGLVLVNTKAGADTPEAAAGRRKSAEQVNADGPKSVVDGMLAKFFSPSNKDSALVNEVLDIMGAAKAPGVAGALLGMAERPDSTGFLPQIAAPTLVIAGDDDQVIPPAESKQLADGIRGAKLQTVPQAGHLVAMEKADEFNRILKDWLGGLR